MTSQKLKYNEWSKACANLPVFKIIAADHAENAWQKILICVGFESPGSHVAITSRK